jgi:uridine monophosphate synthetase
MTSLKDILIRDLLEKQCIQVGNFTLKNGDISKYYFDIKNIISTPSLLKLIGDAMYEMMGDFDIICGIPHGGLPIATYISVTYNKPLLYVREKAKSYGTKNRIEGQYNETDRCVMVDDVMTTGGSIQETLDYLQGKVKVQQCIVVVDRQQGGNADKIQCLVNKTDIIRYRIQELKEKKKSCLCFSADLVSDLPKLWSIIEEIGDYMVICKIHYDTVHETQKAEFKTKLIELSIRYDFLIMEDRKFNDISQIVKKQYAPFENWVDLVTVHTLVSPDVVKQLAGVLLVANMSNNTYEFAKEAIELATEMETRVVGFISQHRINDQFLCMTPGVSVTFDRKKDEDQNYRQVSEIDTDIFIVGRGIYESTNIKDTIQSFLYM